MPHQTDVLALVPREMVQDQRLVPLRLKNGRLEVAVDRPLKGTVLRDLTFLTGKTIVPIKVSAEEIDELLVEHFGALATPQHKTNDATYTTSKITPASNESSPSRPRITVTGSVIQQIDQILRQAIRQQASDIHIEPYETFFRVRFRLDGVLHTLGTLSLLQKNAILSRVKVMAGLDIAERRRPCPKTQAVAPAAGGIGPAG